MLSYSEAIAIFVAAEVTAFSVAFAYLAWTGHNANKLFQQRLDKLK